MIFFNSKWKYQVHTNSTFSSVFFIHFGLPFVSGFSPLLFWIFIIDVFKLSGNNSLVLLAHDTSYLVENEFFF